MELDKWIHGVGELHDGGQRKLKCLCESFWPRKRWTAVAKPPVDPIFKRKKKNPKSNLCFFRPQSKCPLINWDP